MGLPDALSRRHYAPIFDKVLLEAQELGILVETQEEKKRAKEDYMLAENGLTDLGKELPIHCIEMTRDRPTREIAVLTRKRAETGGVPLMPPLEEHRRP